MAALSLQFSLAHTDTLFPIHWWCIHDLPINLNIAADCVKYISIIGLSSIKAKLDLLILFMFPLDACLKCLFYFLGVISDTWSCCELGSKENMSLRLLIQVSYTAKKSIKRKIYASYEYLSQVLLSNSVFGLLKLVCFQCYNLHHVCTFRDQNL